MVGKVELKFYNGGLLWWEVGGSREVGWFCHQPPVLFKILCFCSSAFTLFLFLPRNF